MGLFAGFSFKRNYRFQVIIVLLFALLFLQACASVSDPVSNDVYGVPAEFFDEPLKIIVSAKSPDELSAEFGMMGRSGALRYLHELELEDKGSLQAGSSTQSVVFVILGPASVGTRFDTTYTFTRSTASAASDPTDKPFTQRFRQTVEWGMPVNPTIIINGTFSTFKGDFIYRLYRNGKEFFSRKILIPNDAN